MVLLNVVTLKSYYTGPLAKQLNSVDISWIVGAVVTAVVYWLLTRNLDVAAEKAAIERSDAELRRIESAAREDPVRAHLPPRVVPVGGDEGPPALTCRDDLEMAIGGEDLTVCERARG